MGDMGSTVMGFVFAVLAVAGSAAGVPAFVTLLLLGAAIGDAALTLARRVARRERIFSPHRTHYYQRLTSLGLSHKQVTLLEYLVAALLGVSALFTFKGDRLFVTFFSVTWLVFFLLTLAKIRSMERGGRLFWEGRTVAVAAGDLVFIAASYILSYYLRLNFSIPEAHASSMLMSLPLVLVIRSVVFYYYGLYRSVWRYTTFDDVARIVKAISLSSLIMIVSFTLLFRFRAFPRSVFIIDWFILTVFITGSRIATRWFHELPQKEEVSGKRILIGGTGPMAELVVQQLKKTGGCRPVGFLDDRSEMIGRMIHGMEVLGPSGEIERIVRKHEIDEIVCIRSLLDRFPAPLLLSLQKTGVTVRVVSDPSEVPDVGSDSRQRAPFAGMRVLVAGNGELAECAGAIFTDARGITVISDEARVLGESVALSHSHGEGISVYLGLLGDREALSAIIERHRPELIIADFTTGTGSLSNPMEGYVRTVIIPMERMARLAAEGGDVRFIAIVRCADPEGSGAECAPLALEKILGEVFASGRDSCTIVRSPMRMSATAWAGGLHELPPSGGSVYRIETFGYGGNDLARMRESNII
ncbi:MAG: hypothetical protein JSV33_03435 [bacterium]|nr:MAG: hypothetical protein JSV33_03435 [bacterium]